MQILHIISGLGDGGAEAVLFRLCQFDKQHKHTVISLTDKDKYGSMLNEIGVDVYALKIINNKRKLRSFIKLYKLIKQLKPDIVQTWMIHADLIGGVIARFAGIKNIFWGIHHSKLEGGRLISQIGRLNAFLSHFIPRKIIYCAEKSRKLQESIGFNKAKGTVINNGYNTEEFIPKQSLGTKLRKDLKISNSAFLIGHVGRYDPLKDLPTLFKSFAVLSNLSFDFSVVLAGTNLDKENEELSNLINKYKLNEYIYLLGRRDDIPAIMNGIDILVLSSTTEAFPNVINEAMACGTPCISTDVGDSSLIIDETGWIVPVKDFRSIADAVLKASEEKDFNQNAWKQRKNSCQQRIVNNFNIQRMVMQYENLWLNC